MSIQRNARGADISLWQPKVKWADAAKDLAFIYIKATQITSKGSIDPLFISHWNGAHEAGIPKGAYHFFTTETQPEVQARKFCEAVAAQGLGWGELPLMVDIETYNGMRRISKAAYTAALKTCLDLIEKITGRKPGIYTSESKWKELTTLPDWAPQYPLWVANWYAPKPKLPAGWDDYLLWQTGLGLVKGFRLPIDVNKWNGAYPKMSNKITATITDDTLLTPTQKALGQVGALLSAPQQRVKLSFNGGGVVIGLEDSTLTVDVVNAMTEAGMTHDKSELSQFCDGQTSS